VPEQFDRHHQDDGWDGLGSRSELNRRHQKLGETPAKRPPAKKDPNLCKETHWKGPHTPEIRPSKGLRPDCKWDSSFINPGKSVWCCIHEEVCSGCGKILRLKVNNDECPAFRPITEDELTQIREWDDRVLRRSSGRNRLIKGRQSYRKRRD
jgi:hypothetical protein